MELLPAAVQGGDRRRRRHRDVLVQRAQRRPGLREPLHRDDDPQAAVGLRRLHRERLHRGRRAARVPAGEPGHRARAATASPRTARRRRSKALNAGTDSEMVSTNYRDFGAQLVASAPGLDERASTTPCAGSCGSSSAPGCSSTRTSTSRGAAGKQLLPRQPRRRALAAGRSMVLLKNDGNVLPLDPAKKTAVIGPLRRQRRTTCSARGGAAGDDDGRGLGRSPASRRRTRARRSRPAAR